MAVIKNLVKLGDSRAVVLPKVFLDQLDLSEHAEVELTLEKDRIIVTLHRYAMCHVVAHLIIPRAGGDTIASGYSQIANDS